MTSPLASLVPVFADLSTAGMILIGIMILVATAAYLVWLVKRKL